MHATELIKKNAKAHVISLGYTEEQAESISESVLKAYKQSQIKATDFLSVAKKQAIEQYGRIKKQKRIE